MRTPSHAANRRGKEDVMSDPTPAPTRTLPNKPSLAQLRKQAKELRKAYRARREAAVAEVERFERSPDPANFALADAQRVLARAYGFASWTALKNHLKGVNLAALIAAAEAGDVAAVRRLIKARPDLINQHAGSGGGALHCAVLSRNEELTRVLMQFGADARTGFWPHRDATTAYAIAVDHEYGEIVATIEREEDNRRAQLRHGGTPTSAAVVGLRQAIAEGRTAEAIALLESDPALIGACDLDGVTPLHLAAWKHDPAMVGWLLDHGASPSALASRGAVRCDSVEPGKTPLDFAAIVAGWAPEGRDRVFYFMENARVDPARFHETARLLLQKGAELTPSSAVALGDRETVLRLHRDGRLPNEIQMFRGGLLAIAARVNRLDMVATLLDLGLDPDESVVTEGERSSGMPLWFASMCGRHEIAELLLARGADVNAIVYACGDALGNAQDEQMKALLLKHGARITVEQLPGGEQGREMAKAILAGTLPAYSLKRDNPTPTDLAEQMLWAASWTDAEIVRMCLPHTPRPSDDPWWHYVLVHAALPESVKLILEHGVHPDIRGGAGYTILHHLASDYGHVSNDRVLRATMLLDAGASLTIRDSLLQSTPLGWACRWGHIDLVRLYLERGADAVEADAEPWATPLAWATKRGHHEIVELLRSRGAVADGQ
jgi:ankyrin repeat protein